MSATSLRTVTGETVGQSSGLPGQQMTLANSPVDPATIALTVTTGEDTPVAWTPVEDLFASSATDTDYALDPAAGTVTFGDGVHGSIPPAGSDITASYRYGGGARDNVAAGAASALQAPVLGVSAVTNASPAAGGQDAQTPDDLQAAAPAMLRSQQRAVTAADFQAGGDAGGRGGPGHRAALRQPRLPRGQRPRRGHGGHRAGAHRPRPGHAGPGAGAEGGGGPGPGRHAAGHRRGLRRRPGLPPGAGDRAHRDRALRQSRPGEPGDHGARSMRSCPRCRCRCSDGTSSTPRDFGEDFYPTSLYRAILDVGNVVAVPNLSVSVDGIQYQLTDVVTLAPNELLAVGRRRQLPADRGAAIGQPGGAGMSAPRQAILFDAAHRVARQRRQRRHARGGRAAPDRQRRHGRRVRRRTRPGWPHPPGPTPRTCSSACSAGTGWVRRYDPATGGFAEIFNAADYGLEAATAWPPPVRTSTSWTPAGARSS